MTRMLIFGDRNWLPRYREDGKIDKDQTALIEALSFEALDLIASYFDVDSVIEGCATGADQMGDRWASSAKRDLTHFPADWDRYGKRAGPLRNIQMLEEGKPDFAVGFHNDIENSKGSKHMASIASKAGVPVYVLTDAELFEMR